MSATQQALTAGRAIGTRPIRRAWHGGLQGSEYAWAIAFALPYAAIFLLFVVYPICYGFYLGSEPALYSQLFADPRYLTAVVNTLLYVGIGVNVHILLAFLLSGFFMRKRWWIKWLLVVWILPWATPALPAYISIHWFFNGQWGMLNNVLYMLFGIDGPVYLNSRWMGMACNITAYVWKNTPFWTVIFLAGRMAIPQELYEAANVDGATGMRRFRHVTMPLMANLLHRLHPAFHRLHARRLQRGVLRLWWRSGDVHRGAGHTGHPLCIHRGAAAPRCGGGLDRTAGAHSPGLPADAKAPHVGGATMSATTAGGRVRSTTARKQLATPLHYRLQRYLVEAVSLLLGFVLVIWSITPIYNMIMIALDSHDDVFSGAVWPANPSLESFRVVFTEDFWYLARFWHQFGNSFYVGLMTMFLTLLIASLASFTVGRMRMKNGWMLTNAALMTYVIPASFLAIPFYRIMQIYGLSDNLWSVIAAMVTFATPYAIFIFSQYGKSIPMELDKSARIDGANPLQIYFKIYLPLMAPALVAVGTYALLLAWNEYLYQFLLLSKPENMTVAVALAQFLNSDKSPWNYMMATAIIYAIPPIVMYYGFRRYMAAGLTMGGVKG